MSSLQLISQAVPSIPQQNLSLFRSIVADIRDKLSKLTALAVNVESTHVERIHNSLLADAIDAVGAMEDAIDKERNRVGDSNPTRKSELDTRHRETWPTYAAGQLHWCHQSAHQ